MLILSASHSWSLSIARAYFSIAEFDRPGPLFFCCLGVHESRSRASGQDLKKRRAREVSGAGKTGGVAQEQEVSDE